MTTTINASTTAGLVQTADTSGALALQTANTTAVSISASQVVTLTNALPVASGGTGQITANASFNAIAPSQTSNSGKYLTTDGTNSSWASVSASAATPTALGTVYGKTDSSALAFIGYNAGVNTTGTGNTALGYVALQTNTSGTYNTAVGWNAGQAATGSENTFLGVQAGSASTGSYNVALGKQALQQNTSGGSNVGIGLQALASNTTASNQVAVGYEAGYAATTAGDYTFVGYRAGKNTTVNGNASAFGSNALRDNTTGYQITAIGDGALIANTSGFKNIAVGTNSLAAMNSGSSNTSVGAASGGSCTGGSNTLIGADTGANLTSGNVNTFVGRYAGQVFTTGSYNTHIGYATNGSGAGQGSEIVISGGPSGATGKGGDTGFITPNGGPMFQGNNAGSWSTVSDRRLKKNIVDNNEGLNKIAQIQVRNFEYRIEEEITDLPKEQVIKKTGIQFGVIAQELQAVLPDCVTEQSTGVLTIDSDNLTWYLINAVKELKAELDALKAKVA